MASSQQLRGNRSSVNMSSNMSFRGSHIVWKQQISYCLSSDGNRIGNGVKIELRQCDNTWSSVGQNFVIDTYGKVRMQQDPNYCVVVDGDQYNNGSQIQLWQCDGNIRNQTWGNGLPRGAG